MPNESVVQIVVQRNSRYILHLVHVCFGISQIHEIFASTRCLWIRQFKQPAASQSGSALGSLVHEPRRARPFSLCWACQP